MSPFTEFLEDVLGVIDVRDLEPEEIRILCEDEVFRTVARYCLERGRSSGCGGARSTFDNDELGIDPEEEADDATTDV